MQHLRITIRLTAPGCARVRLDGEIDAHETTPLHELAASLVAAGVLDATLDLGGATFLDLGGLRAITEFTEAMARAGGVARVCDAAPRVARVIDLAESLTAR